MKKTEDKRKKVTETETEKAERGANMEVITETGTMTDSWTD